MYVSCNAYSEPSYNLIIISNIYQVIVEKIKIQKVKRK